MKNNHKKKYNFISNIPFELSFFVIDNYVGTSAEIKQFKIYMEHLLLDRKE